ncbi:MAG: SDR family NAD(P)-dependent oxidoreductase [Saprospiraceae bacterium]
MKNYLIIGASSGVGKALAQRLAEEGHQVFGTYNSQVADSQNLAVKYSQLDVLATDLDLDFLPDQLDGLVYCPGSINLKPFNRIKPEAFVKDFELQVGGAIKIIQAVLPKLKASENASIIMFSTVAVQQGFNFHSQVSTSKGAIEGLTRALAAEFAPRIRVNCIAPSLLDTPLAGKLLSTDAKKEANAERHPMKQIGQAEDIASMAEFLLGEKASWITGQIFQVDGGMSSIKG